MKCDVCKQKMSVSLELTGGCMGDHGEDRCYCDSSDTHFEFYCTNPQCKQRKRIVIPALGDKYSIERFINKHLDVIAGLL